MRLLALHACMVVSVKVGYSAAVGALNFLDPPLDCLMAGLKLFRIILYE